LAYIEKLGLLIGTNFRVSSLIDYNHSIEIQVAQKNSFIITKETAQKIYVDITKK
jgi:hypothetical protein